MSELTTEQAFELSSKLDNGIGGEICAAIALALEKYQADEVHDNESFTLTIKPTFSTWAARQTTLRQLPERKK